MAAINTQNICFDAATQTDPKEGPFHVVIINSGRVTSRLIVWFRGEEGTPITVRPEIAKSLIQELTNYYSSYLDNLNENSTTHVKQEHTGFFVVPLSPPVEPEEDPSPICIVVAEKVLSNSFLRL